jgi:LysR family transcriptional regulator, hca operon transcriptional activator
MELRHIRYFLTVAETESFTHASEKLFIAQPSLSQQIKDLEHEVGVSLFDRSSRKVRLTDEGLAFKVYAKHALDNANQAIAVARQVAQQKNNQLHIGFLNVAELKIMPNILSQLKQHIPDLKIHLHSLTCTEQIQKLKKAELDISFTRYRVTHPDFANIHVLSEQIYLVGATPLHPSERILKLQELKNHTIIMCEKNASPVFYEKLNNLIPFDQQQHEQMLWVTNVMQHLNLINMGMGLSFVPEYLLKFLNDSVKVIQTDIQLPSLGLYASYHQDSKNPALSMITEALNISNDPNVEESTC